ncbi:organic solvent tolerance protein OstA [Solibacillus cecembensis]|uniref:organic solvent tolerance protein OstA n=1 Tax=Solibacillus cecembensis TaxID=459347 RepID=UPI003CFBDFC3
MAKEKLYTKERWYADSHEEAEGIVTEAKQDESLTMQKIHEKHNSKGFYYLVDLERTYSTAKEEMDKRPEKDEAPDGQMSIEEVHEGVEVTTDGKGNVSVKNDEMPNF